MLSFLLSHGGDLETHQLNKLCCRVPRHERGTSLHFDRDIGQETSAQDRRRLRNGGTNEANSATNAKSHRAPSRGNDRRENRSRDDSVQDRSLAGDQETGDCFYKPCLLPKQPRQVPGVPGSQGRRTDERRDKGRHSLPSGIGS